MNSIVNTEGVGEIGYLPVVENQEPVRARQETKGFLRASEASEFTMEFDNYEEVPGNIAQEIIDGKRR